MSPREIVDAYGIILPVVALLCGTFLVERLVFHVSRTVRILGQGWPPVGKDADGDDAAPWED